MSVGRQLDVSQKCQKCQLDVENVRNMSVGRQKCQLDVKKNVRNVSWTSEMSEMSHQIRRTDQIRSDQTVEKRTVL